MTHHPRTLHRAALTSLALAAALAALPAAPAHAADRYWTFIDGCSTADWIATTAGANAQGRFNCWADTFGGLSGQPFPTAADDVFVLAPGATSTLLVNVASPLRPAFTAAARDITVSGNGNFAAGLNVDRNALAVRNILIGQEGLNFIGRVDQSAGTVTIGNNLAVRAGAYNLSGGSLTVGQIFVRSQQAPARYAQTGGTLITSAIDVRSEFGRDASFSVLGGTVTGSALTLGGALGAGSSTASVSNFGTVWNTTGATIVGVLGAGTLNINSSGRALTGSAIVGSGVGVNGTVNVADLGSNWIVDGLLTVGNAGNGVLNVGNGGHVSAASTLLNGRVGNVATATVTGVRSQLDSEVLIVGRTRDAWIDIAAGGAATANFGVVGEGADGTARIIGSGSRWTNATSLLVGQDKTGRIEVIDRAQLQSTAASVGVNAGAVGNVLLTGGAHWQATNNAATAGSVVVGVAGTGSVTLGQGATLTTRATTIGDAQSTPGFLARGTGSVAIDGNATLWTTDTLTIGDRGTGSFAATGGGRLAAGSAVVGFAVDGHGLLTANGTGTRVDIAQTLQVGVATDGTVKVGGGAELAVTGATTLGIIGNGSGALRVEDAGSRFTTGQPVVVGALGQGSFTVATGGGASVGTLSIGQQNNFARGTGSVTVTDPGSTLSASGAVLVGDGGFGTLNIANGGLVVSNGVTQAGTNGRIVLDGGTLRSATVALGDPARLDWRSGTLHLTGQPGVALDGVQLPSLLQLLPGRNLQVDWTLTVGSDSTLLLSGGRLRADAVRLDGGVLASTGAGAHALDMDLISILVGQGQVAARVVGGVGLHDIVAQGPLTLGLLNRSDGFAFSGRLTAGANQVLLLDSDLAALGVSTSLTGGQLVTVNGAKLNPGALLVSNISSSVQGRFVNSGQVASVTGTLSFFDRVSGSGSFNGSVLFLAGYDPGDFAGGVAHTGFGDGSVMFDRFSTLVLDIAGTAPGNGFDRLEHIGALRFDGTLVLRFGAGFSAAPGTVLQLLDYDTFSGTLDPSHVVVDGYNRADLDFSRLAIDGTVTVGAVPEPGTLALWLAGLGVFALRTRRSMLR